MAPGLSSRVTVRPGAPGTPEEAEPTRDAGDKDKGTRRNAAFWGQEKESSRERPIAGARARGGGGKARIASPVPRFEAISGSGCRIRAARRTPDGRRGDKAERRRRGGTETRTETGTATHPGDRLNLGEILGCNL